MNFVDIRAYNDSQDFPTCCGSRYREDFVGKLDKDTGEIKLVSVGKTDLFELIQSYKDETDINTLIQRAEAGDLSAFRSAVFGDFTDMPESYADALNVVIEAEREFNHLPVEIKQKFDNDFYKYIVTAGQPDWLEKFGIKKDEKVDDVKKKVDDVKKKVEDVKKEVNENEQKQ